MNKGVRAFIGALALTVLGFSAGVVTDRVWLYHAASVETPDIVRDRLLDDLRATVDLTDDQLRSVHTILARNQEVITHAWDEVQPRLRAAVDSVWTQISAILDPHQLEGFHRWFAETHHLPTTHSQ